MALPNFLLQGSLYKINEECFFILDDTENQHYLTFGILVRGFEEGFYPESLLDDWGHEITGLALFNWIRENGVEFPRAELFGFNDLNENRQYFLRELEFWSRYPCIVSRNIIRKPTDGMDLDNVVLLDKGYRSLERIQPPSTTEFPFIKANVKWWRVGPKLAPSILTRIATDS